MKLFGFRLFRFPRYNGSTNDHPNDPRYHLIKVIDGWFEEYPWNGAHFSQIVSDTSYKIGCGYKYCPDKQWKDYIVCNYYQYNYNNGYTKAISKTGEDCLGNRVSPSTGLCF